MSLMETISVDGVPRHDALIDNAVICLYKEMFGEIISQKLDLNERADSNRIVS